MGAPKGNKFAEGNAGGRPTKYKPEYAEQAYKLCLLGHTNEELATFFEVAPSTIDEWIAKNNEFSGAVKKGKVIADGEAAEGLYKRAVGFTYDEVTFEKIDGKVNLELSTAGDIKTEDAYRKKVVTKMIAPDPGAALNWLKNRQPQKWREKIEVEQKNYNYNSDPLSPEKIKEIRQNLHDSY